MSEIKTIKINKEIPFEGTTDSLETRLRNVTLRGFPELKIYRNSKFQYTFLNKKEISKKLCTPQPNIYKSNIERIQKTAELFQALGIDIFNLKMAYDFTALDSNRELTEWTMMPPIIEAWNIPKDSQDNLDYEPLIGKEVKNVLQQQNLRINSEIQTLPKLNKSNPLWIINDGAHRIFYASITKGCKIIVASNMETGFPYYATPQPYSTTQLTDGPTKNTTVMKIHIVESPAQKTLYRNFPSGGIKTGEVRPPTEGETFI